MLGGPGNAAAKTLLKRCWNAQDFKPCWPWNAIRGVIPESHRVVPGPDLGVEVIWDPGTVTTWLHLKNQAWKLFNHLDTPEIASRTFFDRYANIHGFFGGISDLEMVRCPYLWSWISYRASTELCHHILMAIGPHSNLQGLHMTTQVPLPARYLCRPCPAGCSCSPAGCFQMDFCWSTKWIDLDRF